MMTLKLTVLLALFSVVFCATVQENEPAAAAAPQNVKEENTEETEEVLILDSSKLETLLRHERINKKESGENALSKKSLRRPGSHLYGATILCEGYTPKVHTWSSTSPGTQIHIRYTVGSCSLFPIYGSLSGGIRYLDHANIWATGQFTGLDTFREWAIACNNNGRVTITSTYRGRRRTLAQCTLGYEAHVVSFGI